MAAEQTLAQKSPPGEPVGGNSADGQILTLRALIASDRADDLEVATELSHQALRTIVEPAERAGRPLTAGESIYRFLGSILLEWNDLEAVEQSLARALRQIELSGMPGVLAVLDSELSGLWKYG